MAAESVSSVCFMDHMGFMFLLNLLPAIQKCKHLHTTLDFQHLLKKIYLRILGIDSNKAGVGGRGGVQVVEERVFVRTQCFFYSPISCKYLSLCL